MAGAITTGTSAPSAVVAQVVTGVSSTAAAIFPAVFAVAGASSSTSAHPSRPHSSTCSTLPVISVTTGSSVAKSTAHGWTMFVAEGDMTARTLAPWRRSSCASSSTFTAAMLPETPSATLTPSSITDIVPAAAAYKVSLRLRSGPVRLVAVLRRGEVGRGQQRAHRVGLQRSQYPGGGPAHEGGPGPLVGVRHRQPVDAGRVRLQVLDRGRDDLGLRV